MPLFKKKSKNHNEFLSTKNIYGEEMLVLYKVGKTLEIKRILTNIYIYLSLRILSGSKSRITKFKIYLFTTRLNPYTLFGWREIRKREREKERREKEGRDSTFLLFGRQRNREERLKNCRAHHFLSSLQSSEERGEKCFSLCYSYFALAFKYKVLTHGTPLF